MSAITLEQRDKLLSALRAGHDLWAAADKAGVDPALVQGDAELLSACERAFATATSKLRSKLTEKCLQGGPADITTLMRTIEGRAALQREQFRPPAAVAQEGGFDLSELSDDNLFILQAVLEGDFGEVDRLIQERAVGLAAEMAREELRRRADGEIRPRPIQELSELDEQHPIPPARALTLPIAAR